MSQRIPLPVFAVAICLAVWVGFIIGGRGLRETSLAPRLAATPPPSPSGSVAPTPEAMRALARQIASGESAALTRLENLHAELYRDLNYQRDTERVRANLVLMRAAFDQLGADAGAGNPNAFAALQQALDTGLRSHVPDSLGIAAAAGHAEALDLLLEYNQHGILFSSAVFALGKPAAKNNEKAVAFLADVLADPKHRALSHAASQGLIPAAQAGNPRARAALDAYAAREPK